MTHKDTAYPHRKYMLRSIAEHCFHPEHDEKYKSFVKKNLIYVISVVQMNRNSLEIVEMHILLVENMILIRLYVASQQPRARNVETMK